MELCFYIVALSRIMHRNDTALASPRARSRTSVKVDLRIVKLAKSYYENSGIDATVDYGNISSILEELYAWEKKLYKEVKVCKKLVILIHTQHFSELHMPDVLLSCISFSESMLLCMIHHILD